MTTDFKNVKDKFLAKTFQTYKTVKKAFVVWKDNKSYIEFDHFKFFMDSWGFANDCIEEHLCNVQSIEYNIIKMVNLIYHLEDIKLLIITTSKIKIMNYY